MTWNALSNAFTDTTEDCDIEMCSLCFKRVATHDGLCEDCLAK